MHEGVENMGVDLNGWNNNKQYKPEVKDQLNESARSDDCWVLLIDASIQPAWYWKSKDGNGGSFGYKENQVSHWAYQIPSLPKDFIPRKID